MENNTAKNGLTRRHGAGTCIRMGYSLYADNFKTILKSSWIPALIYSLVCAAMGALCVIHIPDIAVTMMRGTAPDAETSRLPETIFAILFAAGGLTEIVFYSCGMSLLRSHKADGMIDKSRGWLSFDTRTALRTLKITLTTILVCSLTAVVLWVTYIYLLNAAGLKTVSLLKSVVITGVFTTVIGIMFLPLIFPIMKYILNDNGKLFATLTSGYVAGLRRLPFILAVSFVAMCVTVAVSIVTQLPTIILTAANAQSIYGTVYGDPLGMPSYMPALTAATFFAAGLLQAYIRMSVLFPLYYAYGSVETFFKEKKESKTKQNTTNQ
ncbi:MAG: hypothetical protein J6B91_02685 [Prevotella sp.]|nr:hypothetical protein [Prevotella sp.]